MHRNPPAERLDPGADQIEPDAAPGVQRLGNGGKPGLEDELAQLLLPLRGKAELPGPAAEGLEVEPRAPGC